VGDNPPGRGSGRAPPSDLLNTILPRPACDLIRLSARFRDEIRIHYRADSKVSRKFRHHVDFVPGVGPLTPRAISR
jgi:hypothetical protein